LAAAYRGNLDEGRAVLSRTTDLAEQAGSPQHLAMSLFFTGLVEIWFGDLDTGQAAAERALRLHIESGYVLEQAYDIEILAWLATRRGEHPRAAVLFGVADARWERCGSTAKIAAGLGHEMFASETLAALGQARFAATVEQGRGMDDEQTWQFAFAATGSRAGAVDPMAPLTRREVEIATLVAEGLSNPAIADHLVIARRTVDTHVGNILTKLDFNSRSQIARWITERTAPDAD
jgi:non-specific serine/threonine protein kinase